MGIFIRMPVTRDLNNGHCDSIHEMYCSRNSTTRKRREMQENFYDNSIISLYQLSLLLSRVKYPTMEQIRIFLALKFYNFPLGHDRDLKPMPLAVRIDTTLVNPNHPKV